MTTRKDITAKILDIKRSKGLSWAEIAKELGNGSPVLYTAALLGQMTLTRDEAGKASVVLGLTKEEASLLTQSPYRGSLPECPPTDPLVYRFFELVQIYGTTFKALIEEEFGDGIMSAIDFDVKIELQEDTKGDRVKITMSGKFLPFKRF